MPDQLETRSNSSSRTDVAQLGETTKELNFETDPHDVTIATASKTVIPGASVTKEQPQENKGSDITGENLSLDSQKNDVKYDQLMESTDHSTMEREEGENIDQILKDKQSLEEATEKVVQEHPAEGKESTILKTINIEGSAAEKDQVEQKESNFAEEPVRTNSEEESVENDSVKEKNFSREEAPIVEEESANVAVEDAFEEDVLEEEPTKEELMTDELTKDASTKAELIIIESEKDEPTIGEPIKDEPIKDEPTEDELIKDEPAEDELITDGLTEDEITKDDLTKGERIEDGPVGDAPIKDEPTKDEPTKDELTEDELAKDETTTNESTKEEPGKDVTAEAELDKDEPTKDELIDKVPAPLTGSKASKWATKDDDEKVEAPKRSRWERPADCQSHFPKTGSGASRWARDRYEEPSSGRLNRSTFESFGRLNRDSFEDNSGRLNRNTFEDRSGRLNRSDFEDSSRNNYYDRDERSSNNFFDRDDRSNNNYYDRERCTIVKDPRNILPVPEVDAESIKNWNNYKPPPDENKIKRRREEQVTLMEEEKSAEVKPVETKHAEANPVDVKPVAAKPVIKRVPTLPLADINNFKPLHSWADDMDDSTDDEEWPTLQSDEGKSEGSAPKPIAKVEIYKVTQESDTYSERYEKPLPPISQPKLSDDGLHSKAEFFEEGKDEELVSETNEPVDEANKHQEVSDNSENVISSVEATSAPATYSWGPLENSSPPTPNEKEPIEKDETASVAFVQEEEPIQKDEGTVQDEEEIKNTPLTELETKSLPIYTWGSLEEPSPVHEVLPVEEPVVIVDEKEALQAWHSLGHAAKEERSLPQTTPTNVEAIAIEEPANDWSKNAFWNTDATIEPVQQQDESWDKTTSWNTVASTNESQIDVSNNSNTWDNQHDTTPAETGHSWGVIEDSAPVIPEKPVIKDSWKNKIPVVKDDNVSSWKSFVETVSTIPPAPVKEDPVAHNEVVNDWDIAKAEPAVKQEAINRSSLPKNLLATTSSTWGSVANPSVNESIPATVQSGWGCTAETSTEEKAPAVVEPSGWSNFANQPIKEPIEEEVPVTKGTSWSKWADKPATSKPSTVAPVAEQAPVNTNSGWGDFASSHATPPIATSSNSKNIPLTSLKLGSLPNSGKQASTVMNLKFDDLLSTPTSSSPSTVPNTQSLKFSDLSINIGSGTAEPITKVKISDLTKPLVPKNHSTESTQGALNQKFGHVKPITTKEVSSAPTSGINLKFGKLTTSNKSPVVSNQSLPNNINLKMGNFVQPAVNPALSIKLSDLSQKPPIAGEHLSVKLGSSKRSPIVSQSSLPSWGDSNSQSTAGQWNNFKD